MLSIVTERLVFWVFAQIDLLCAEIAKSWRMIWQPWGKSELHGTPSEMTVLLTVVQT